MTTIIVILAVYLVGCLLSYGRLMGIIYEIDEESINHTPPLKYDFSFICRSTILISFSFISFIVMCFPGECGKYLFKWSKKELWKQYYENKK